MYELKKIGKVLTSKFVGTGPSSYKERIYRAAVSQNLRNTGIKEREGKLAGGDMLEKRKLLFMKGVEPRFDGTQSSTVQSLQHLRHLDLFSYKQWSDVRMNVTLRSVRVTTVAAEKQNCFIFRVCECSLNYPACNAHAP